MRLGGVGGVSSSMTGSVKQIGNIPWRPFLTDRIFSRMSRVLEPFRMEHKVSKDSLESQLNLQL